MERKIMFIAQGVKWFDKVNGNTYHSARVTRCADGQIITAPFQYGYGDQWRWTALEAMFKSGWIPEKFKDHLGAWERSENYPVEWVITQGLKRDCVQNGKI